DMAYELLVAEPVFGLDTYHDVLASNADLHDHFPQLAYKPAPLGADPPTWRLPAWLFPKSLDGAARGIGESAWRYMQWTRRHHPDALARVSYVRATMRSYALFALRR